VPAILLLIGSGALFAACFFLCTANNDFPASYHPDEPGKVQQILQDTRNYHHPLLMLDVADAATKWLQTPRRFQSIAEVGRGTSAVFSATAAVLIGLAGFVVEGWAGFVLLGLAAGLCPSVISHAHYFKEEASLAFGVGCVVFAAALLTRSRHAVTLLLSTVLLGIACGTAASGKYPGAIFLAPSLVLVIVACGRRWIVMPIAIVLLCALAAATWYGINYRAVQNWDDFKHGFGDEEEHVTTEHFGLTMDQPNDYFVSAMVNEAMPHVAVLGVAAPFLLLLQRRRVLLGAWIILAGGIYLLGLSYSVVPFFRYVLPVSLLLNVLAALAVVWLARLAIGRPMLRGLILGGGIAVIAYAQLERCLDYDDQFANDSRDALQQWVKANVPADSLIAADNYTELNGYGMKGMPRVIRRSWAASFSGDGNPETLRKRGFDYIITASSSCERWLLPQARAPAGDEQAFKRLQRFYITLERNYVPIWQSKAAHPMDTFANPDIAVYRLPPLRPNQSR